MRKDVCTSCFEVDVQKVMDCHRWRRTKARASEKVGRSFSYQAV